MEDAPKAEYSTMARIALIVLWGTFLAILLAFGWSQFFVMNMILENHARGASVASLWRLPAHLITVWLVLVTYICAIYTEIRHLKFSLQDLMIQAVVQILILFMVMAILAHMPPHREDGASMRGDLAAEVAGV